MSRSTDRVNQHFAGRLVVITGAGGGIGRELALQCGRAGARLALCDMNADGLDGTADEATASGAEVFSQVVDVSDAEQMNSFAKEVEARLGTVDVLINNAGIAVIGGFLETTLPDWERLIGVNLMGVVNGNSAFIPAMVKRGSGHVVNVSSAAGVLANPQLGAYSADEVRGVRPVGGAADGVGTARHTRHRDLPGDHQHRDHNDQPLPGWR